MKAFVIHLPQFEHSVIYATGMVKTLIEYGIEAELFEGTLGTSAVDMAAEQGKKLYPFSIKNKKISRGDLEKYIRPELFNEFLDNHEWTIYEKQKMTDQGEIDKMSAPGVLGCFYSHYRLWQHCVKIGEPMMIFEDDVKFFRPFVPIEFEDVLILSLGKTSYMTEPQKTYLENPQGTPYAMPWKNFSMPGASGYAIKPKAALRLTKHYRPYWYPADNAINKFVCNIQIHNYIMGRNTLRDEGNISLTRYKDW
jgi:hypothetical protein